MARRGARRAAHRKGGRTIDVGRAVGREDHREREREEHDGLRAVDEADDHHPVVAHADALAETAPAFLGAAARRRVCECAALKNCLEKLLFEATAASALDARAEALLRAYLDGAGDEAADALRAFAVL